MGYTTDFEGSFKLDKPVDEETYMLLVGLGSTRRMARKVDAKYGVEGEFYVGGDGFMGQDNDSTVIDNNREPKTQPGLWCQWLIQDDHQTIEWNGCEKFYHYFEWINYLNDKILKPRGYVLNGRVCFQGEESDDQGAIIAKDGAITYGY